MNRETILEYYRYFDEKYTEWHTHPKERNSIEQLVRQYAKNLPDEIYCAISPDNATGLMEHGFFESDLKKTISYLKSLL